MKTAALNGHCVMVFLLPFLVIDMPPITAKTVLKLENIPAKAMLSTSTQNSLETLKIALSIFNETKFPASLSINSSAASSNFLSVFMKNESTFTEQILNKSTVAPVTLNLELSILGNTLEEKDNLFIETMNEQSSNDDTSQQLAAKLKAVPSKNAVTFKHVQNSDSFDEESKTTNGKFLESLDSLGDKKKKQLSDTCNTVNDDCPTRIKNTKCHPVLKRCLCTIGWKLRKGRCVSHTCILDYDCGNLRGIFSDSLFCKGKICDCDWNEKISKSGFECDYNTGLIVAIVVPSVLVPIILCGGSLLIYYCYVYKSKSSQSKAHQVKSGQGMVKQSSSKQGMGVPKQKAKSSFVAT